MAFVGGNNFQADGQLARTISGGGGGHGGNSLQRRDTVWSRSNNDSQYDSNEEVIPPTEAQRLERVATLARTVSNYQGQHAARATSRSPADSVQTAVGGNFVSAKDEERPPYLDPSNPEFSAKAWVTNLLQGIEQSPHASPFRKGGVAFSNLSVHGQAADATYQSTVGNLIPTMIKNAFSKNNGKVDILQNLDGVIQPGEMLMVLGPPGSGCSTFLKALSGETHGCEVNKETQMNYHGISAEEMHSKFRGEAIYCAEVEYNFPTLTVGQTLEFAALARLPSKRFPGLSRTEMAQHYRDVIMAMFGISHTINTKVGNDFIRGVSGGERKRVSIAEVALAGSPFSCWDNATRGLDSANAIEFCKTLRLLSSLGGAASAVAIYQAPESAYQCFDKVTVLYDGHMIYYGSIHKAKNFFIEMGFNCPEQQSTPDFLTSLTSPSQRRARSGMESQVPTTAAEFAARWKASDLYRELRQEIDQFNNEHEIGGKDKEAFVESRRVQQAKRARPGSPYTLSYLGQISLCLKRGFWRLKADPFITLFQLISNVIIALVISSIFYNMPTTTSSFQNRSATLFFAVLISAFGTMLEMLTLYAQRPIVEKHKRYAFYHPSAEAFASMLTDMPYKIVNAIGFNLVLYIMTNLNRTPGAFFFYLLVSFLTTLTMSMFFRSVASLSRSLVEAVTPSAVIILGLVLYTGYAIPITYMHGWSRWINYIDPVAYGFEALMINEFSGRTFECTNVVPSGPGYTNLANNQYSCSAVGGQPGSLTVNGEDYINLAYQYSHGHKWRNVGIIIAFMLFLMVVYLIAAELVSEKKSKGEVLLWPRWALKKLERAAKTNDVEKGAIVGSAPVATRVSRAEEITKTFKQTSVFHWQNLRYTVPIKKERRLILNNVDGWVKPGTLTALMGVSGAGKTTLLDVCASRVRTGVVEGDLLVDGKPRSISFQRQTGYVQQQDLHLPTSTVREALTFSALLRQPAEVSEQDKLDYVEEVLVLLEMDKYADAVVGVQGEGLNVEQRKRLTIGVELAAKPELLLFVDEPTSGLDSDTSWSIIQLLKKLAGEGMSILCTVHQPSALLFAEFDRLLFLAKGGRTVYFGEVGKESHVLRSYFEQNGAHACPPGANPAEWMLEVIGAAPGSHTDIDWHQTWLDSPERQAVRDHLAELAANSTPKTEEPAGHHREYAAPIGVQLKVVLRRVWQQYWRTPSYLYAKLALVILVGLFVGFSFYNAPTSIQGLQNQLLAVFMIFTIFNQLVQQFMPLFVTQRSIYETREAPSKTFSWRIFMASNAIVEMPWALLASVFLFFCWYYPIGVYRNAEVTDAVNERGALMFLFVWQFVMFASTFGLMAIAGVDTAEAGSNIAQVLFSMSLIFCGVLAAPLNGAWWKWIWYMVPFRYFAEGMLVTALKDTRITCSIEEYVRLDPPSGQTCGTFMSNYISSAGGYLIDEAATQGCQYCPIAETNKYLENNLLYPENGWRDFGIIWVYIVFNVVAATAIYKLARVPKKRKEKATVTQNQQEPQANGTAA